MAPTDDRDATPDLVQSANSIEFDDSTDTYHISYDPAVDTACIAVVDLISTITNTDIEVLEPLQHTLDVPSFNQLIANTRTDYQVAFQYAGFHITVDGSGDIACTEATDR